MKRLYSLLVGLFALVQFGFAAVNVNTASQDELSTLKSIGPAKAKAIVEYRQANGPFKSVDDLANVKGIKGKTLDKIRAEVSVSGASSIPAAAAATTAKSTATNAATNAAAAKMAPVAPAPATPTPAAPKAADLKAAAKDAAQAKAGEAKTSATDAAKAKAVDALKSTAGAR